MVIILLPFTNLFTHTYMVTPLIDHAPKAMLLPHTYSHSTLTGAVPLHKYPSPAVVACQVLCCACLVYVGTAWFHLVTGYLLRLRLVFWFAPFLAWSICFCLFPVNVDIFLFCPCLYLSFFLIYCCWIFVVVSHCFPP